MLEASIENVTFRKMLNWHFVPLQDERRPSTVTLTNTGLQKAIFCLLAQASRQWWGQPEGHDAGLPDWLEVYPLDGCIAPQVITSTCI